jgi:GNAT superfamily N-acetyltransferase
MKKSISQTPAPKKDRIYGSKVNAKGSASSEKSASEIKLSATIIAALTTKLKEFREKHSNKNITLNDLKAVYRRGLGAYSTSHRPNITRNAWAMARVNKFLLKAGGTKVKSAYVQDDDLMKYENGGGFTIGKPIEFYQRTYADGTTQKISIDDYEKNVLPYLEKGGALYLAPNGKPSNLNETQWKLVRTAEFKAWFGDWEKLANIKITDSGVDDSTLELLGRDVSKVVDENGEPLVVYHGTYAKEQFGVFDFDKADLGFHFGTYEQGKDRSQTRMYVEGYKSIINPYFLNVRKLVNVHDVKEWEYPQRYIDTLISEGLITEKEAKQNGFFDIYYREDNKLIREFLINKFGNIGFDYENKIETKGISYIVLEANQIKLADGTNTMFDSNNPDIRFDGGGMTYRQYADTQFNEEEDKYLSEDYFEPFKIEEGKKEEYPTLVKEKDALQYRKWKFGGIGVFDGEKMVAFADNGSIQVSPSYQKRGIGLELVTILKEMNPNHRFGNMTPQGFALMENYYNTKIATNPDIRYEKGGEIKSFYTWFLNWYKGVSKEIDIMISLPNEISGLKSIPYQDENAVILDMFRKKDQNIDAKPYLQTILNKADEYGITIYLLPDPNYKYIDDVQYRTKISTEYLIDYYKDFGFELTPDNEFMKRGYKKAKSGDEGQEITCRNCGWQWNTKDSEEHDKYVCHKCNFDNRTYYDVDPIGYKYGGQVNNCKEFILQNKAVLTNGFYFNMNDLSKLFDPYGQVPTHLDFTLVSYNSDGQSNLDVIDTINPTTLVDRLSDLLGLEKNQSYVVVNYVIANAKRLTNINQITTEKIVVVDIDMVVCENLNEYAGGGEVEQHEETYAKWKSLVNMSYGEIESFYNSKEGKEAGLSSSEAKEQGISSGRESARMLMKMKLTSKDNWTPTMWKWANKQISFISRMRGVEGELYDDNGNKTRKHTSLLIWGHNPKKDSSMSYADGGEFQDLSQTELNFMDSKKNLYLHDINKPMVESNFYEKGGDLKYDSANVKQYFAHGSGNAGGVLVGKRHSEGGIKAVNKSTGQPLEMEGGEVVITRNAVSDGKKREFEGEMLTNKEILSRINESGGGVKIFSEGGDIESDTCSCSGKSYKYGGKMMVDYDIAKQIASTDKQAYYRSLSNESYETGGVLDISNLNTTEMYVLDKLDNDVHAKCTVHRNKISDISNIQDLGMVYSTPKKGDSSCYEVRLTEYGKSVLNEIDIPDGHFAKGGQTADCGCGKSYANGGGVDTDTEYKYFKGIDADYKNQFEINKAIEELISSTPSEQLTAEEKGFIGYFSGYGGLEKYGATGKGLLYEYFTPSKIAKKMWALAYKHGFEGGKVLEPSCGIGEFIKYAPEQELVTGYEINEISAKICKILYPKANIQSKYFETFFIKNNNSIRGDIKNLPKFSLVIGNPPYGTMGGKYAGMGEKSYTKSNNYIDYFINRGLDLLEKDGLLIYIIGTEVAAGGTPFLMQQMNEAKRIISQKANLLDAYRLPNGLFDTTDVVTDIIVLQKK